jgi:CHASE2 domain-containing sensor protein
MPSSAGDDPRVVEALRSSVLLGAVASVMQWMWRAVAASRTGAVATAAKHEWDRHPRRERLLAVGIMLVAAAVTSVVLIAAHETPAGWLWLAPPAIAATLGAVGMFSERAARN